MEALGVHFEVNRTAGKDFTVDSLFADGCDAVFIGSGTAVAKELDLPGKELDGIIQSSYLLRMIALYNSHQLDRREVPVENGDRAVVIGCGNVAMDAARSLLRMGAASVQVIYRGKQETMPALKAEYEGAVTDGATFLWEHTPVAYEGETRVTGLRVTTPDGERSIAADKVYLAVGSRPANRIVSSTEGIEVDGNGYVITRERPYGMTTRQGVFAGGDVMHRPATVVLAMKEAKLVAEGIAAYVDAVRLLEL
ncbi:FAD-dependent oxidoreductase, partial [Ruminococcaceae bacterium OttesenSCG-928-L11]|nr:FAD-dependent oxidoreductase [Ruminococcaceae bacterium OttesenSCG-928-L11]